MSTKLSKWTIDRQLSHICQKNEKIHWTGCSESPSLFVAQDLFLIPFSILYGGVAVFYESFVIQEHGSISLFFALLGIPFILVAMYLTVGRFYVRHKLLESTFYAVTDRRVIVVNLWPKKRVRSLPLEVLRVNLTLGGNGVGDLVFGDLLPRYSLSFSRIRNASELFQLISKLQLQTKQSILAPAKT